MSVSKKSFSAASILLAAMSALAVSGCDDADSCVKGTIICSSDGTAIRVCTDGEWADTPCESAFCYISTDGPKCMDAAESGICTPGQKACTAESGFVKTCSARGQWEFLGCPYGQTCLDGECAKGAVDTNRTCSADHRGIVDAASGATRSCLEETGVDSVCVEYSGGLVGCEAPQKCDDTFSDAGTCLANRLAYCDHTFTNDRPLTRDCAALGTVCKSYLGTSGCFETCDAAEAFSCRAGASGEALVSHCVSVDGNVIRDTRAAICNGNSTVTCSNGSPITTECRLGTTCVPSAGTCLATCTALESGDVQCDQNGRMTQCQQTVDGFWAYVSVGARECVGTDLKTCIVDEDTGKYVVKTTDCLNQIYENETAFFSDHGKCVKDLMYYEDYDQCYPAFDGTPCGASVTEEGSCTGSVLTYCDTDDHIRVDTDCAANKYGYTSCTVFADFADCREPCSTRGQARCEYQDMGDGTGQSTLFLCVPDQNDPSRLSWLIATSGCLDQTQYTCDRTNVVQTNCAANGGICGVTACEYPLCSVASSATCNGGLVCSTGDDGIVNGLALCR